MSAIRKILLPTDFSEASRGAVNYACELAAALNASVSLLHVVEYPYPLAGPLEYSDVGLVVMATHGRGGVARLMMGSVADKIVRAAPCPVLTIRARGAEQTGTPQAA